VEDDLERSVCRDLEGSKRVLLKVLCIFILLEGLKNTSQDIGSLCRDSNQLINFPLAKLAQCWQVFRMNKTAPCFNDFLRFRRKFSQDM